MSPGQGTGIWSTLRDWYCATPRPLRRLHLWYLVPVLAMSIPLIVEMIWKVHLSFWSNPGIVLLASQLLLIPITLPRLRRIRREFKESGGRLCTHCAQSLAGLDDIGRCPECGEPYHIEFDRVVWKKVGMEWRGR